MHAAKHSIHHHPNQLDYTLLWRSVSCRIMSLFRSIHTIHSYRSVSATGTYMGISDEITIVESGKTWEAKPATNNTTNPSTNRTPLGILPRRRRSHYVDELLVLSTSYVCETCFQEISSFPKDRLTVSNDTLEYLCPHHNMRPGALSRPYNTTQLVPFSFPHQRPGAEAKQHNDTIPHDIECQSRVGMT